MHTFIVEPVDAVDGCALVIAAKQEKVLGVLRTLIVAEDSKKMHFDNRYN